MGNTLVENSVYALAFRQLTETAWLNRVERQLSGIDCFSDLAFVAQLGDASGRQLDKHPKDQQIGFSRSLCFSRCFTAARMALEASARRACQLIISGGGLCR